MSCICCRPHPTNGSSIKASFRGPLTRRRFCLLAPENPRARGRYARILLDVRRGRTRAGPPLHTADPRGARTCALRSVAAVHVPVARRQPEKRSVADLFLRRRSRRPARPQADRCQHAQVPHAGGQAAHARARHVVCSRRGRRERRPHLLGPAHGARRSARCVAGRKGPRGRFQSLRARAGYGQRAGAEESGRAADRGVVRDDDAVDACLFPAGRSRLFRERRGR